MDEDRIKGAAKEKVGEVKKNLGKVTGDEKMKREGQVEQIGGKVQNTIGGLKDSIREQKHEDKRENR